MMKRTAYFHVIASAINLFASSPVSASGQREVLEIVDLESINAEYCSEIRFVPPQPAEHARRAELRGAVEDLVAGLTQPTIEILGDVKLMGEIDCGLATLDAQLYGPLIRYFGLADFSTPVAIELDRLGIRSPRQKASFLVGAASDDLRGVEVDLVGIRRRAALQLEDSLPPSETAPKGCGELATAEVNFGAFRRVLRFATCPNGAVNFYLWERGWWTPTDDDLKAACVTREPRTFCGGN